MLVLGSRGEAPLNPKTKYNNKDKCKNKIEICLYIWNICTLKINIASDKKEDHNWKIKLVCPSFVNVLAGHERRKGVLKMS